MTIFDKSQIKSNFNKAHRTYNQYAILQKKVASNLVEFSKGYIANAQDILDLGSGTGFVADNVNSQDKNLVQLDIAYDMLQFHQKELGNILNVNGDIESLPFKDESFDLVISSFSFQWLSNLDLAIRKIAKIKKPNGAFAFSLICDGSLKELKSSAFSCNVNLSVNDFVKPEDLKIILNKYFSKINIKSKDVIMKYDNIYDLLKSIKSIGAGYKSGDSILTRGDFDKINSFYLKNFNSNGKLASTWCVYYAICK